MESLSKCIGRDADFDKFVFQNFSWMDGAHGVHGNSLSVIINNFYVVRPVLSPLKANSPLLVNTYALLTGSVTTQRFKTVAGKIHQVFNAGGAFKNL